VKHHILHILSAIFSYRFSNTFAAANIGEGTHEGGITKLADAVISQRHLLGKHGSDVDHVALCGASDSPLGTITDEATAIEDPVAVDMLGQGASTKKMVASEPMTYDAEVFTAAGGKIQGLPVVAGTYYRVGKLLKSAAADNDVVEVASHVAIELVISE